MEESVDIKVLLGKRIREYRKKHNLTQFQLAERIGIDDKHLSRIELGKNMPQANTILRLAEVFGIEVKDLFEFSYLKPAAEIGKELEGLIQKLTDEQLVMTYKYVKSFVI